MRKSFLGILTTVFFLSLFTLNASAASNYPKQVLVESASTTSLQGGVAIPIRIVFESKLESSGSMLFDIGVSREIKEKNLTQFQILSTTQITHNELSRENNTYEVEIPNPINGTAVDTYRIYVKSYLPNNPDSESLVVSKPFSIITSVAPTILLDGASIVTNLGSKAALNAGPVIYKNPTISLPTSVKLLLDLESNTETVLEAKIHFTKLRSNQFIYKTDPFKVNVKKGETLEMISLPTFEYEPGVYKGELVLNSLEGTKGPGKMEFMYIVDGPMATVGQMNFVSKDWGKYVFKMEVFGKPTDHFSTILNDVATSTEVHTTKFVFLDEKGNSLLTEIVNIDYATSTYMLQVRGNKVKDAKQVQIETESDGKTIFKTVQNIAVPEDTKSMTPLLYAGLVTLLSIGLYIYTRKRWLLILLVILGLFSLVAYAVAAPWVWSDFGYVSSGSYSQVDTRYTLSHNFAQSPVSCDPAGTDMLIKVDWRTSGASSGFYFGWADAQGSPTNTYPALEEAEDNKVAVGSSLVSSSCTVETCGGTSHPNLYTLNYMFLRNLKGPLVADYDIAVHTEARQGSSWGSQTFVLWRVATNCDYCSNIPGNQITPDFTSGSQKFFYSSVDDKLYLTWSSTMPLSPQVCQLDMCTNQPGYQSAIPAGQSWNLSSVDLYTRYSCTTPLTASCSAPSGVVNNPVNFTSTVAGGITPYTYLWSGSFASTTANPRPVFTTTGVKSAQVQVTDAGGQQVTSAICSSTISTPPPITSVSCSSSSSGITNTPITFSSSVTGGTAPYTYSWTGSFTSTAANPSQMFTTTGEKTAQVTVTDSLGLTATSAAGDCNVNITAALTASCSAPDGVVDTPVSFSSSITGGTVPYTYSWTGSFTSTAANPSQTFTTTGEKTAQVAVTDTYGRQVTSALCSSTISENPVTIATPEIDSTLGECGSTIVGKNTIHLTFNTDTLTTPATFTVYRKTSAGATYSEIGSASGSVSGSELIGSFNDTNATPGTTYNYKVMVTNSGGTSEFSAVATEDTLADCPDPDCGTLADNPMSNLPDASEYEMLCTESDVDSSSIHFDEADNKYKWNCTEGSTVLSCWAPKQTESDALCGDSDGEEFDEAPSIGLCDPGAASTISTGASTYSWTCISQNGQVIKHCSADRDTTLPPEGSVACGGVSPQCSTGNFVTGSNETKQENGQTYSQWMCESADGVHTKICKAYPDAPCVLGSPKCPHTVTICDESDPDCHFAFGNFVADPALVNANGSCSVYVGKDSPTFSHLTANTTCSLKFPNESAARTNSEFKPYTIVGTGERSQDVAAESSYALTCWESGVNELGVADGTRDNIDSKTAICRINPSSVEISFWQKFKSMGASALNAAARFFNLK